MNWHVFAYPGTIPISSETILKYSAMFINFMKTAWRALWKRKSFTLLNIMGLAVGIAASLLIFLVIQNEVSYDAHHKNKDRIYRITGYITKRSNGEITERYPNTPLPLPDAMRQDFPQVRKVAAINPIGEAQLYVPGKDLSGEKRFKENDGLFWIEPSLFEIFDFKWIAGSYSGLKDPGTAVLTESLANKFFGAPGAAIGKTIQLWSFRIPLQIVGVYKDPPSNTDIPVRMGASYATMRSRMDPDAFTNPERWSSGGSQQTFVLLDEKVPAGAIQAQLPGFVKKYYKHDPVSDRHLVLQPLTGMHLDKDYYTFTYDRLAVKDLWSLGLIGIFLLLVACINFINLSTAQSVNRSKEIGVRKVLGSNRSQLIKQFLRETSLVTLLAVVLGYLLAVAALPLLNQLMHKEFSINPAEKTVILLYLLITGLVVTLLAGFYPALVLSGFKPAMIFRNKSNPKASGILLRRGLVVFQFVIAQLLIIGTVVVFQQMRYFREKPLGIDRDGIAMINLPSDSSLRVKYSLLVSRMLQIPGITSAGLCWQAPAVPWSWDNKFTYDNETAFRDFSISRQYGDTAYYKTFGIKLITGRFPFHSDSTTEVVVNETLVKKLGLHSPEEIIGKTIAFGGVTRAPVVGVVKDYNNRTLRDEINPLAISSETFFYEHLAIRVERSRMKSTMDQVQSLFSNIYPTYMYDVSYFDQRLESFYANEAITSQLFKIFAFLAIFISCLGLYGLVSFMAVQKTREVGIRKVLGASVQSIVYLFSKEFTLLIGIAFLIATPLGYYFMKSWLSDFHYHITIGWGVFVLVIVLSLFIAWITVGYKAIRAALVSPVKSLKTE
jgi:putative ABC transport system permease protein